MKKYLITILFLLLVNSLSAQKFNVLSKKEKTDLKLLAKEYLDEFNEDLLDIPKMSTTYRLSAIKRLKRKFIKGATIQVANSKTNIDTILVVNYLDKVLASYGKRYKIINIEITSATISDIKPMEEKPGFYYADFVFVQKFCRSNKNRNVEGIVDFDYCDSTTKKGKFIVKKVITSQGTRWKLFYGNIDVIDYKRL